MAVEKRERNVHYILKEWITTVFLSVALVWLLVDYTEYKVENLKQHQKTDTRVTKLEARDSDMQEIKDLLKELNNRVRSMEIANGGTKK